MVNSITSGELLMKTLKSLIFSFRPSGMELQQSDSSNAYCAVMAANLERS
jgi:hypothetical protein